VVLGAAIYNTKWHADAHQFLARHQAALAHAEMLQLA
jgi:menaquinone-dependent protoporphyrinogen IX oxidase